MTKTIVTVSDLSPNELRDVVGALCEHLNLKIVRTTGYGENEVEVMSEEDAEQYKEKWQR